MASLQDVPLARDVLAELSGEGERYERPRATGRWQGRGDIAGNYRPVGGLETGREDFTAADFFEAYADAIEKRAQELERNRGKVTAEIRDELLKALDYFSRPDNDYRLWPQSGLRAMAMLAPIHVASGVLGPSEDLLQLAIRAYQPNKSWAWWRALGVALLSEQTDSTVMEQFNLTLRAVHKYRKFLLGRQQAAGKAA